MKERSTHEGNVTTRQLQCAFLNISPLTALQRVVSLSTITLHRKEISTQAGIVTIWQLQRVISLNNNNLYMKKRIIYAGNVTIRQQSRVISHNINKLFMKERSTNAGNVTTRQLQRVISLHTSKLYIKEKKFPCKGCAHHATSKGHSTQHFHSMNLSRNYPYNLCNQLRNVLSNKHIEKVLILNWYHY